MLKKLNEKLKILRSKLFEPYLLDHPYPINRLHFIILTLLTHLLSPKLVKRKIEADLCSHTVIREVNGFKMILHPIEPGIHRELFLYRKREYISTDFLLNGEVIKEGDFVLDIGANIGYYVLLESKLVGSSGKVYALEPISYNLERLIVNCKLNNIINVRIFHLAASDKNGIIKIYIPRESNLCSTQFNPNINYIGVKTVNCVTIDSFLEKYGKPSLIRMDVEGHESKIIKGMYNTLDFDVKLLIEIHGHLMTEKEIKDMFIILREKGYEVKFAAVDHKHSFNKIADLVIRKLGGISSIKLNMKIDSLERWILEGNTAHVFLVKE